PSPSDRGLLPGRDPFRSAFALVRRRVGKSRQLATVAPAAPVAGSDYPGSDLTCRRTSDNSAGFPTIANRRALALRLVPATSCLSTSHGSAIAGTCSAISSRL